MLHHFRAHHHIEGREVQLSQLLWIGRRLVERYGAEAKAGYRDAAGAGIHAHHAVPPGLELLGEGAVAAAEIENNRPLLRRGFIHGGGGGGANS